MNITVTPDELGLIREALGIAAGKLDNDAAQYDGHRLGEQWAERSKLMDELHDRLPDPDMTCEHCGRPWSELPEPTTRTSETWHGSAECVADQGPGHRTGIRVMTDAEAWTAGDEARDRREAEAAEATERWNSQADHRNYGGGF